ncbi:signal peptidase I [Candidatus Thorarchaeota archaeon]|nr:MAG: signal peptidase I [Candidatus Thorarchaeota archaeon]
MEKIGLKGHIMEKIRQKIQWDEKPEFVKTGFLLFLVVGATLGGYGVFMFAMGTTTPIVVVTSDSMEPTLYRGDLLIIQAREPDQIALNDIVVYQDEVWHSDGPIVHRVVEIEIVEGDYYYFTKGDNNPTRDPYNRTYSEIVGVVVATIPWLGNISLFLRTPVGIVVMVGLFVAILVLPEIFSNDEDEEPSSTTKAEDSQREESLSSGTD